MKERRKQFIFNKPENEPINPLGECDEGRCVMESLEKRIRKLEILVSGLMEHLNMDSYTCSKCGRLRFGTPPMKNNRTWDPVCPSCFYLIEKEYKEITAMDEV